MNKLYKARFALLLTSVPLVEAFLITHYANKFDALSGLLQCTIIFGSIALLLIISLKFKATYHSTRIINDGNPFNKFGNPEVVAELISSSIPGDNRNSL